MAQPERIGEIEQMLADGETNLAEVADGILEAVGAARVSISEIDLGDDAFEIIEARGEVLLGPGTRFPLGTSTHHRSAAAGKVFVSSDFDQRRGFSRPLDRIVREHGFRSGASLPLRHEKGRHGALNLHFDSTGSTATDACALVEPLRGVLSLALAQPDEIAPTSVLVCHDDPLIGHGIARLLEETGLARASIARSPSDAALSGPLRAPDVVIGDLALGGRRIDAWIGELRAAGVDAPLLVIAPHDGGDSLGVALAAGAAGFVLRAEVGDALSLAVDAVSRGQSWLPRSRARRQETALTPRELDVLSCLDRGMRFRQIADGLGISQTTAKTHARSLFRKLGASSRSEATYTARQRGLLG
ncbi:MAG: LuxR C-terminal-related transcriptional regulator [Thermoleophilia bacterium]|nr:LuxR C-terminal-related transcriptional regulator [Thermoleophilia bacterium]